MTVLVILLCVWVALSALALLFVIYTHERQVDVLVATLQSALEMIDKRWPLESYPVHVAPVTEMAAKMRDEAEQNAALETRARHEGIIKRGVENLRENYASRGVPTPDDDELRQEAEELARQAGIV